jgi:transketolase
MLAARYPRPGFIGQRVFGICSDGDLMEGISHEACSLAGHLGLGNLKFFYDDNHISIDGETELSLSDNAQMRFESYGWFVQRIDGHDPAQIRAALDKAVAETERPSLIIARTHIGNGSPNKHDSEKAHGSPLGKAEVELTKKAAGWPLEPTFYVPDEVRDVFRRRAEENASVRAAWLQELESLTPEERATWQAQLAREVPANLLEELMAEALKLELKPEATRALGGKIEQIAAKACPWLVGGSADLNPSTLTFINGSPAIAKGEYAGRNIHFGIREHAMAAINNGLCLSDAFVSFGSTFLVFADYMRPAIRLAALMEQPQIFVFTHDSIFLGEDGPTHQPIEHLAALRLIPNVRVVRPADARECAAAWTYALERKDGPTVLVFTRQKLPTLERPASVTARAIVAGAHRVHDPADPKLLIVATGSEVQLAVGAAKALAAKGIAARVVSAPCLEALEDAGAEAESDVLGEEPLPRVSIEAGSTRLWRAFVGRKGLAIGIDSFGASAPDKDLAVRFGMTTEAVLARIEAWLPSV